MRIIIIYALISISIYQLRSEGCRAACIRDGYTSGNYEKGECFCIDSKGKYDDYLHHRMNLGPSIDIPYSNIDDKNINQNLINQDLDYWH